MSLAITCGDTVWNYMKFHHKFKRNLLFAVRIGGRFLTNNKTADRAERRKAVFNWQKILKLAHLCKGGCLRSRLGDWKHWLNHILEFYSNGVFLSPPSKVCDFCHLSRQREACIIYSVLERRKTTKIYISGTMWASYPTMTHTLCVRKQDYISASVHNSLPPSQIRDFCHLPRQREACVLIYWNSK